VLNAWRMIHEHELCKRSFRFACEVAKLCGRLQGRGPIVRRLSLKLLDAGTSIGANVEEAQGGQTKPDFIAKNFISLKESRETRFWLRVISAIDPPLENELRPFLQEANEFIAMLTALLKTARSSLSRGSRNLQ
jgi:four helix bundle protein